MPSKKSDLIAERKRLADRLSPARPDDIRAARELLGLTQTELAVALGVSQQAVSDAESGSRHPRPAHLMALAELLRAG